jgi:hypothetical protein
LKTNRLLKNAHLLRFPNPSSLRRTSKYAAFLRISWALHLGIFEQPTKNDLFSNLLNSQTKTEIPKQVRDDKKEDCAFVVMLNLGLMKIRLVSASL